MSTLPLKSNTESSGSPSTITSTNFLSTDNQNVMITINSTAQLPIKLSPLNFSSWRCQFNFILVGYNLQGYVDGSFPYSQPFISQTDATSKTVQQVPNSAYDHWKRQDQLLLHAIISSLFEPVVPYVALAISSKDI
ncbi:hypothetical protein PTKIN_Ptkin12aG0149000 [Pterospermum kingtungense]